MTPTDKMVEAAARAVGLDDKKLAEKLITAFLDELEKENYAVVKKPSADAAGRIGTLSVVSPT